MRTVLELFTKKIIVLLALVVFCGPVMFFRLDTRFGIIIMGLIFSLSGAGHIMVSSMEAVRWLRITQKSLGIFIFFVGTLLVAGSILMFVTGTPVR